MTRHLRKTRPDDPRNNLLLEFLRITIELEARAFMMENVPPLLTEKRFSPLFEEFVRRATDAGYIVTDKRGFLCDHIRGREEEADQAPAPQPEAVETPGSTDERGG